MVKEAIARLDETMTFIRSKQVVSTLNREMFDSVVEALDAWMLNAAPATKARLSALMSKPKAEANPTSGAPRMTFDSEGRKFLRAAILIDCALVVPRSEWDTTASQNRRMGRVFDYTNKVYTSSPQSPFILAIQRARDEVYSTPSMLNGLLRELRADPVGLLGRIPFSVDGGSKDGNPVTYGVWMDQGVLNFGCQGVGTLGHMVIKAANVRATAYRDVRDRLDDITAVDVADAPGCDLMFTTQFTGCAFCFMKDPTGMGLRAAHIDPGKGTGSVSGTELSTILRRETGGLSFSNGNGGTLKIFGRVPNRSTTFGYPESSGHMIVVGVRRGTEWRLYSQVQSVDGTLSAQRIDA